MNNNDCKNEEKRNSANYKRFVNRVKRRDGKRCTICGSTENLCVHHLLPFAVYPDLRIDTANGTTLCKKCHGIIHGREF